MGNGGIDPVGSPTPVTQVPGSTTQWSTQVTVKSKASNWNWTPGSVSLSFTAPPVPIYCPGDPNPISTCPGCSGVSPTLVVYKDGTYPPVEGTDEVIMGPKCVKIGDIVSYTVYPRYTWVQTAFPDSYQWNVNETNTTEAFPFGLQWLKGLRVLYWSGDRSSITVMVENDFDGGELQINAGTANSCNTEIYRLSLGLIPTRFKIVATSIDGVVQSPPIEAICLPMDASQHTFKLEVISDEYYPGTQILRSLGNLNFVWSHGPSPAFQKIDNGSKKTQSEYQSLIYEGCPRGSAGSITVTTTTNCPVPNTPYSAGIQIKRSFTDQEITTVPNQSPICIDDIGSRYDFFINNLSCNSDVTWTPPGPGWYAHEPKADPPVNGSVWSGHVAVPPATNGQAVYIKVKDACNNERQLARPIIVSWNSLDVELEFITDGSGQGKCPQLRAHIVNLPEGCCSDNFEFIWTHSNGDAGFCQRRNPSGCGENWVAFWEPGLVTVTIKTCKENPCGRCYRSERFTFRIPNTPEIRELIKACIGERICPRKENQCKPTGPGPNPESGNTEETQLYKGGRDQSGFSILPNPATSEFVIQLIEKIEQGTFEVLDSRGKVVESGAITGKSIHIKTKSYSRGPYAVRVSTDKQVWKQTLILE